MKKLEATHKYDDIIDLPHHVSTKHPPMSMENRAAQFAPFAALTGHNEAIQETARLTEQKAQLDENAMELLDRKLHQIKLQLPYRPVVTIVYFAKDRLKAGGEYKTITSAVKKIDEMENIIITENEKIKINDILEIII